MLGVRIPADQPVAVMLHLGHHMEEYWPEPERLRPERFASHRREDKVHRYAWEPFGGGVHKCLGMAFAGAEVKLIVHQLLRRFDWTVDADYRDRLNYHSLPFPADGQPVALQPPRKDAHSHEQARHLRTHRRHHRGRPRDRRGHRRAAGRAGSDGRPRRPRRGPGAAGRRADRAAAPWARASTSPVPSRGRPSSPRSARSVRSTCWSTTPGSCRSARCSRSPSRDARRSSTSTCTASSTAPRRSRRAWSTAVAGTIVNVASAVGRVAVADGATYSASKFAAVGFSEATRAELKPHGIDVTVVLPTIVQTELAAGVPAAAGRQVRHRAGRRRGDRLGDPDRPAPSCGCRAGSRAMTEGDRRPAALAAGDDRARVQGRPGAGRRATRSRATAYEARVRPPAG